MNDNNSTSFSTPIATINENNCSSQNNLNVSEERNHSTKRKKIFGTLISLAMNMTLCSSFLIIQNNDRSLPIIALINLAITSLAAIASTLRMPQLVIVCVIYKVLCGTYLSFLICKLIDTIVMEQYYITAENVWLIAALICITIEISLLRLSMNFTIKVNEEEQQIQAPPKYSTCTLTSSPTNSQLPTYSEALKMIEEQNERMQKGNPKVQTSPPIYTLQTTETAKSIFKDNFSV